MWISRSSSQIGHWQQRKDSILVHFGKPLWLLGCKIRLGVSAHESTTAEYHPPPRPQHGCWLSSPVTRILSSASLPLPVSFPHLPSNAQSLGSQRQWQLDYQMSSQGSGEHSDSQYEKMLRSSTSMDVAITVCFCLVSCHLCGSTYSGADDTTRLSSGMDMVMISLEN